MIASKKGKASDSNGNRAVDIKTCDETTKDMIRQIFNEVMKQEGCTPETWRKMRIKSDLQEGKMWKMCGSVSSKVSVNTHAVSDQSSLCS